MSPRLVNSFTTNRTCCIFFSKITLHNISLIWGNQNCPISFNSIEIELFYTWSVRGVKIGVYCTGTRMMEGSLVELRDLLKFQKFGILCNGEWKKWNNLPRERASILSIFIQLYYTCDTFVYLCSSAWFGSDYMILHSGNNLKSVWTQELVIVPEIKLFLV